MKTKAFSYLVMLILFSLCQVVKASESSLILQTESGEQINLNQYFGKKPVYLKFWATWCAPCMKQMPHFEQAFKEYGDKIQFVAINIDLNDDQKSITKVKQRFNLTMPMMTDTTGRVAQHYQFLGTPYHVLLDTTGKVIHQGHDADNALDKTLKLLSHDGVAEQTQLLTNKIQQQSDTLSIPKKGVKAIYFTATWCDWYLAESRPKMAKNCIAGQNNVNQLFSQGIAIDSRVSQLWTDTQAVTEYVNKFKIKHSVSIDYGNGLFIDNEISTVPTLLIYKNGQISQRITDFSEKISIVEHQ